jgi:hypothetical protein
VGLIEPTLSRQTSFLNGPARPTGRKQKEKSTGCMKKRRWLLSALIVASKKKCKEDQLALAMASNIRWSPFQNPNSLAISSNLTLISFKKFNVLQARCISDVKADTDHTSFITGTLSLREENEVKTISDFLFFVVC